DQSALTDDTARLARALGARRRPLRSIALLLPEGLKVLIDFGHERAVQCQRQIAVLGERPADEVATAGPDAPPIGDHQLAVVEAGKWILGAAQRDVRLTSQVGHSPVN